MAQLSAFVAAGRTLVIGTDRRSVAPGLLGIAILLATSARRDSILRAFTSAVTNL
jgi:hypothetical protein